MNPIWDPARGQFMVPYQQTQGPGAQPQVHPMVGPPGPQAPYYPQQQYPPQPPPWAFYPPPHYQQQQKPSGPSPTEAKLDEQNQLLRKQLDDMGRRLDEEKHQRESERRESETARKLDEMKASNSREIEALKVALEKTGDKDSKSLLDSLVEMNKGVQHAIIEMKKGEVEGAKANMGLMQKQMESEFEHRKQMYDMIQAAQDPTKHAELIDKFGQSTANYTNMIMQMAQSGLLPQGDNDPPWMQPVRDGISGLQDFLGKMLDQKRDQAAWQRTTSGWQNQSNRSPIIPHAYQPQRGLPPGQQGYAGQPPVMPPQAQPPRPPPIQSPETPPEVEKPTPGAPAGAMSEDTKKKLQVVGQAIYLKENPMQVGEMIYNIADFQRFWRELPADWVDIFTDPETVIRNLLKTHAPMVKVNDDYMEALREVILEIEEQYQEEQRQARQEIQQVPPQQPQPIPVVHIGPNQAGQVVDPFRAQQGQVIDQQPPPPQQPPPSQEAAKPEDDGVPETHKMPRRATPGSKPKAPVDTSRKAKQRGKDKSNQAVEPPPQEG